MDIDFIPFKLGMEYDNWEFDLESDYETTEFDRYYYIKSDTEMLFGFTVEKIFLSFNADILFMVEYELNGEYFDVLKSKLAYLMHKGTFKEYENTMQWSSDNIRVILELSRVPDKSYLTIGGVEKGIHGLSKR